MSEIDGGATLRKKRPSPPRGNSTASERSTITAGQIEDEKGALRARFSVVMTQPDPCRRGRRRSG